MNFFGGGCAGAEAHIVLSTSLARDPKGTPVVPFHKAICEAGFWRSCQFTPEFRNVSFFSTHIGRQKMNTIRREPETDPSA